MPKATRLQLDREGWLTEAAALIYDDLIAPHCNGTPSPPVRISVGFPSNRTNKRAIASCFIRAASSDQTNEIFVTPEMDDSIAILGALVHELVHASDDCQSGHRGHFARVARLVGLDGPLTATTAGPQLQTRLGAYIDLLGPIPHAKLNLKIARPADSTRMIKVSCGDPTSDRPGCGCIFRTSAKWARLIRVASAACPTCQAIGTLIVHSNPV